MNGTRERRAIIAATLAYVETYHGLVDDPIDQMHARDHAHVAAYNAALTTGMHKDRAARPSHGNRRVRDGRPRRRR